MSDLEIEAKSEKKIGNLRLLLFHSVFYFSAVLVSVISCAIAFLPRDWVRQFVYSWCGFLAFILKHMVYIECDIKGLENIPNEPCLFAPKHQSMWDTLMLYYMLPRAVLVAKWELVFIPFFGQGMIKVGFILVKRENQATSLRKLIKECRQRVSQNYSIVIFPEGGRRAVGAEPDYKIGIAALYKYINVPCVPIALNSGLFWPRRSWLRKAGTIKVRVLPAIKPGLSRKAFMEKLENDIETEMKTLI